ncbi:MAG: sigma-70 family RNA polymerase sigma factor [Acidimicrobiia bacterium]|nr:sigma-70 family RNA polymerase sigma factor [Acidimicrobiia bacterium]
MSPVPAEEPASQIALRASFSAFFSAEYRSVVGLASVLSGRRSVGEELAQEAFVAAFRRWDVVGGYEDPGGWVRRVAVNLATSSWRRRVREARALGRLRHRRDAADQMSGIDDEVWAVVRALPAHQAQCVALRYLEDRSVRDIAAVLGIAEATVRVHLHTGRKTLAAHFDETVAEESA